MGVQFLAVMVSAALGWGCHALVGDHLSLFADFMLGTVVSGAGYVASIYYLKKLRGDF